MEMKIEEILKEMKDDYETGVKLTGDYRKRYGGETVKDKKLMSMVNYLLPMVERKHLEELLFDMGVSVKDIEVIAKEIDHARSGLEQEYYAGEYVVVLRNPNSHNYPTSVPIKIIGDPGHRSLNGITWDGFRGNQLPSHKSSVRPASNEEIAWFVTRKLEKVIMENGIDVGNISNFLTEWKNNSIAKGE
jgi:hypothetical protein